MIHLADICIARTLPRFGLQLAWTWAARISSPSAGRTTIVSYTGVCSALLDSLVGCSQASEYTWWPIIGGLRLFLTCTSRYFVHSVCTRIFVVRHPSLIYSCLYCMISRYPGSLVPRPRHSDSQQQQQQEEEERDRERAPIVSPTRTTVWSSNNPSCQNLIMYC